MRKPGAGELKFEKKNMFVRLHKMVLSIFSENVHFLGLKMFGTFG